jgi:hypothetical protein
MADISSINVSVEKVLTLMIKDGDVLEDVILIFAKNVSRLV